MNATTDSGCYTSKHNPSLALNASHFCLPSIALTLMHDIPCFDLWWRGCLGLVRVINLLRNYGQSIFNACFKYSISNLYIWLPYTWIVTRLPLSHSIFNGSPYHVIISDGSQNGRQSRQFPGKVPMNIITRDSSQILNENKRLLSGLFWHSLAFF